MTDDPERFEELVREHQAMVFSMACRYLRNRALAEEIAQDVFLQLYRKLAVAGIAGSCGALAAMGDGAPADRSFAARETPAAVAARRRAGTGGVPRTDADPLLSDMLRDLVAALPENARVVMILRYQEDLDPMDIAQALGHADRHGQEPSAAFAGAAAR